MKKELMLAAGFIIFIGLFLAVASAAFTYIDSNIQNNYIGGQNIQGTLNISFQNEPANALFTSNFNGNTTLVGFLNNNGLADGQNFNCSIRNCGSGYSVSGTPVTSLSMGNNDVKSAGFKITGTDVQITSMRILLTSSFGPSCSNEIQVNVLGNNNAFMRSIEYTNETCGAINRGCFDTSADKSWIMLGQDHFCERFTLPAAPAFQIGAQIKKNAGASGNILMSLFDSNWEPRGTCILPSLTQSIQNISCIIQSPNPAVQDYFICISNDNSGGFYINSEDKSPVCGNSGTYFSAYVIDYDIFAQAMKFASPKIAINETSYQQATGNSLAGIIDDYINQQYNRDCSSSECVIPIDILSADSQNVSIANSEINYRKAGTGQQTTSSTNIYPLQKLNSTINSNPLALDLSKSGISLPTSTNLKVLKLYLNGKMILPSPKSINVTNGFSYTLGPQIALIGVNTKFYVLADSNISSVAWTFGDGSPVQNTATLANYHAYIQEGQYELKTDVIGNNGITISKNITVSVGDAQTAAATLLQQEKSNIGNISSAINSYDAWIRAAISNKINLTAAASYLNALQNQYDNGQYLEVVNALIVMPLPDTITINTFGNLPIEVGYNNINPAYAIALSGNKDSSLNSGDSDILKQNIINWAFDNYNANVDYKIISAQTRDTIEPMYTYFKMAIASSSNLGSTNLVIDYPKESIIFKQNYNAISIDSMTSSATAIPVSGSATIEFLLPGSVQVSELGAFIAPGLDKLGYNIQQIPEVARNERPTIAFWLYVVLAIGVFAVYIALQEWYKKRYETYLFRNKDDLYNLINFIFNSRVSGLGDNETRRKLASYNWKSEQMNYAFRKIDGKRTGMWEIPIFKFIENRRVRKEIEKRQHANFGKERFIKSQY